jgi:hypothetical protein
MYWSPKTLHRPSDGSGGGCRFVNSSGRPGTRTMDDGASSPSPPAYALRSSSMRATLSGVKSFQKGGGLGNVDAMECCSWSAIVLVSAWRIRISTASAELQSSWRPSVQIRRHQRNGILAIGKDFYAVM